MKKTIACLYLRNIRRRLCPYLTKMASTYIRIYYNFIIPLDERRCCRLVLQIMLLGFQRCCPISRSRFSSLLSLVLNSKIRNEDGRLKCGHTINDERTDGDTRRMGMVSSAVFVIYFSWWYGVLHISSRLQLRVRGLLFNSIWERKIYHLFKDVKSSFNILERTHYQRLILEVQ